MTDFTSCGRTGLSSNERDAGHMNKLISTKEAAEMLGVTEATLKTWRCREKGPEWVKVEGAVRYDTARLLEYIRKHTHVPSVRALVEDHRGTF